MRLTGLLLLTLIMASCGTESGRFRIEGRFRNLNQGEFYVYSHDGGTDGMDTIHVASGRFAYETDLDHPATFIIVFPNFSEQAVFGNSGETVTIEGDASNLKEMEIKGTEDNDEMTAFRMRLNKLMPPEVSAAVAGFVREHPASPAALYAVERYLVRSAVPDYRKAYELTGVMQKAAPDNMKVIGMRRELKQLIASEPGATLPAFTAKAMDGRMAGSKDLKAKVNVVCLWASWSYDSQSMLRTLKELTRKYGKDMAVVSISVDGVAADCDRALERDSISWPNICDGKMWDSPLLGKTGLATVPGCIIADAKGKIVARNLSRQQLRDKIESMLK